ncbi:L,D-transpeptidase [Nocardia otitidiscaviarum]|uniref:L,D-transpeptidase n=1 Tax=Nocardia otitidiscaviarum TaxID=1823 RepID=A0A516NK98_9NOCA|nr:L,D-transpeptidase [Nocardia otitidiscaviarum]MCP9624801.1 L,D-transpeptidase [Nocardia otitidiscaviarum]QDP79328.1 L,D-transpeptidase [Nocardia otitidiscaviarum]
MRNAIRYLFLATVVAALTAFGSGLAAAAIIRPTVPAVQAISPGAGETVGIAAPVRVQFAQPVENRTRAEQSVSIRAGTELAGSFSWQSDRELTWTPEGFLPASTPISVSAGTARTEFNTNAGVTAEGNMSNHTFTVSIGGVPVRTIPASFGKPGWETPTGTFPVLEKFRSIVFDSRTIGIPLNSPEGYLIDGEYAERLTWSGVFVHSAPWSVDSQGNANVSHGCINLPPADAAWYYENVSVGDPVYLHW